MDSFRYVKLFCLWGTEESANKFMYCHQNLVEYCNKATANAAFEITVNFRWYERRIKYQNCSHENMKVTKPQSLCVIIKYTVQSR